MALEDVLEQLTKILAAQGASNERLVQLLEKSRDDSHAIYDVLRRFVYQSEGTQEALSQGLLGLGSAARSTSDAGTKTADALQMLAEQSSKLESAAQTFTSAATQTQQSASELAQLIKLIEIQTQQQSLSLKYQNESIATTLRIAKENSRSGWVQNWLFFFLGILIPIVIQLVFKFF